MRALRSYILGLLLSLFITIAAYTLVVVHMSEHVLSLPIVLVTILSLAVIQLFVQLIFFLHIGQKENSKWTLPFFLFTFFGIFIIVVGSVWIMYHLNYNMTQQQINTYINNESGF